jgi:hypothetical protein
MKRRKSPQEKKKLDAQKQRRGFSEYAHALRHGKWRKKKRRPAQKSERQAERVAVSSPSGDACTDPDFDPGLLRRPSIDKWGATPLAEWIQRKKAARLARAGGKKRRRASRSDRPTVER